MRNKGCKLDQADIYQCRVPRHRDNFLGVKCFSWFQIAFIVGTRDPGTVGVGCFDFMAFNDGGKLERKRKS